MDWHDEYIEKVNREKKEKEKVIKILSRHEIRMNIGGCGCCESPWVEFEYKGEMITDQEEFKIKMIEDEEENGNDG